MRLGVGNSTPNSYLNQQLAETKQAVIMKFNETAIIHQVRKDSNSNAGGSGSDSSEGNIDSLLCGIDDNKEPTRRCPSPISPKSVVNAVDDLLVPMQGRSSPTGPFSVNVLATVEHLKPPRATVIRKNQHRRIASCPIQVSHGRSSSNNNDVDRKDFAVNTKYQQEKDISLLRNLLLVKGDRDRPKLYNQLGTLYYNLGDFKSALECYNQAVNIDTADHNMQANTFQNIGTTQWKLGQFDIAVTSFRIALQTRLIQQQQHQRKDGISVEIAQSYQNLGLGLLLVQDLDEAIVALETAYGIYTNIRELQHSNALDIARRLSFMGTVVAQQATIANSNKSFLFDIALKYHQRALRMKCSSSRKGYSNSTSSSTIRESLIDIGQIFQHVQKYEKSLCMYQEALELLLQEQQKVDDDSLNIERAKIVHKIGSVYEILGDIANATKCFHDAASAFSEAGLPYMIHG
jgi:tetratricopeptide (TPR) repeat protein